MDNMFSANRIAIVKNTKIIGAIQAATFTHFKNTHATYSWESKRGISAECTRFLIDLYGLANEDKLSLLNNGGSDFDFKVVVSNHKVIYDANGHVVEEVSKIFWEEEGFKFSKPIFDYNVWGSLFIVDFVDIFKDLSESVELNL